VVVAGGSQLAIDVRGRAVVELAPGRAQLSGPELCADEHRPAPQRGALQPLPWPPAIAGATASVRHGVEALAWNERNGTVAVLQRPASAPLPRHVLHADDGMRWALVPAAARADVKAIEVRGGNRVLLLERLRDAAPSMPASVLRLFRLDDCATVAQRACHGKAAAWTAASTWKGWRAWW
jgi:hypothetical protein